MGFRNKPVFLCNRQDMKGVWKVSQLLEGGCKSKFLTYENFQNKYDLQNCYLQYYGIISSLTNLRKAITITEKSKRLHDALKHANSSEGLW